MSTTVDLYKTPALVLLVALVAVFGTLWFRKRESPSAAQPGELPSARRRQLLWLIGWMFAAIHLEMEVIGPGQGAVWMAASWACMQLAVLMFLGSLAPQNFSRRIPMLYVVAFGIPLIVYSTTFSVDPTPGTAGRALLMVCCAAAIYVGGKWGLERHLVPVWTSLTFVALTGAAGLWLTLEQHYFATLVLVHNAVLLMTAFLFASTFRRVTAGVIFTVGGLVGWAIPAVLTPLAVHVAAPVFVLRTVHLMQVITAVGMVVLVLEDELASNVANQQRDCRARQEMEKYTELFVAGMPLEDDAGQYRKVCETIAGVSRFAQVAITVRAPQNCFQLAGCAGIDADVAKTLDAVARRTTDEAVVTEIRGRELSVAEIGHVSRVNLQALLQPGEELPPEFREIRTVAIHGRDERLMGALLLAGLRSPEEPLLAEDVLPLALLAARIGAAREHQALQRQLTQAERLAGLGQLAGGVAHELNNPLTVVTGYAELLADSEDPAAREQAMMIRNEARRMKQIIESLMRFRRPSAGRRMPVAIGPMLGEIDQEMRRELQAAGITVELRIEPDLPRVSADGEQLRQVFVQAVKNAARSMREPGEGQEKRLRIEAVPHGRAVRVAILDSGPGFPEPSRAFDPFYTTRHPGQGEGLGLSICYSIIREHGGEMSAVNLQPHGGAVLIELPVEEAEHERETPIESTAAASVR